VLSDNQTIFVDAAGLFYARDKIEFLLKQVEALKQEQLKQIQQLHKIRHQMCIIQSELLFTVAAGLLIGTEAEKIAKRV